MTSPRAIFACDPGLASGWAVWGGGREIYSGTLGTQEMSRLLEDWLEWQGRALVVYESFKITPSTGKLTEAPWSLELIGAARYLVGRKAGAVDFDCSQKPSEAKKLVPDERLKRHGVWRSGQSDHERDALRHLLYAMARHRVLLLQPL